MGGQGFLRQAGGFAFDSVVHFFFLVTNLYFVLMIFTSYLHSLHTLQEGKKTRLKKYYFFFLEKLFLFFLSLRVYIHVK